VNGRRDNPSTGSGLSSRGSRGSRGEQVVKTKSRVVASASSASSAVDNNFGRPLKEFVASKACRSRAHCRACRTDPEWRRLTGAPDVCPHDPDVIELSAVDELDMRLAACRACSNMNCSVKPLAYCRRKRKLRSDDFCCPDGRF